ncbi:3-oxoacyl-ACP synthase III family protein [Streptomyces sp. NPDC019531]|uniref:3-oxoacyl-ACP synthase III family protein n=1 Tax=Streptomyces sp. NPDC019531 TaxID=3365062 RepID=UPI00384B826F
MTVYSTVHTPVGVLGTGSFLPERVVPNELAALPAGVTADWIERKTGIRERHHAAAHEATSDLAAEAAVRALENSGTAPEQLDWIIVATSTPDHPQPATAALLQHRIGAFRAAAFDVNAVCAGFVAALHTGALLCAGTGVAVDGRVLVVGAETYSRIVDPTDRRTAPLFGDGAGAVVLGPVAEGGGVLGTGLATDSRFHDLIGVPAGGSRLPASDKTVAAGDHYFRMRGREVREYVLRELPTAVRELLRAFDVGPEDVDHFVPHQANGAMLKDLLEPLGLPRARAHLPVTHHANTGAASIPLALDEAHRSGLLRRGELVVLAGFGGGMTLGTALLRWTG